MEFLPDSLAGFHGTAAQTYCCEGYVFASEE